MKFLYPSNAAAVSLLGLILMLMVPATIDASSPTISRSYGTESSIKAGSLVSLSKKPNYVQPSNLKNESGLVGIAVGNDESLVAVNADQSKLQVATSGTANTLAGTTNGKIAIGDKIAVSALDGIGIKAKPGDRVIGIAQTSLTAQSSGAIEQTVQASNGISKKIHIGYIKVIIGLGVAPKPDDNINGLQKLTQTLVGKTISTTRIIIVLAVTILAATAIITLIYTAISTSIVSIGRNPLAKYAVFHTLGSVLGMIVALAVITVTVIYMLLR